MDYGVVSQSDRLGGFATCRRVIPGDDIASRPKTYRRVVTLHWQVDFQEVALHLEKQKPETKPDAGVALCA